MKNNIKSGIVLLLLLVLSVNLHAQKENKQGKKAEKGIITLSAKSYKEEISKGVVLVDYWAVWCGPCRKMEPILKEIASETNVKVGKLNVDDYKAFVRLQKISIVPTMIIYKDSIEVERLSGAYTKAEIMDVLKNYM